MKITSVQREAGSDQRKNVITVLRLYASRCTLHANKGFTLVEMLVVMGIMGVLLGLAIPAYNTFNQNQHLRQSGEALLQALRELQNRAVSGKNAANCPAIPTPSPGTATQYTFNGWYMLLTQNAANYTTAGYCGMEQAYASGAIQTKSGIPFAGEGVTIQNITLNTTGVISPVYVLFKPVSQSVSFYNSTFPTGTPLPDTSATIRLQRGTDVYNVTVTRGGAIYVP